MLSYISISTSINLGIGWYHFCLLFFAFLKFLETNTKILFRRIVFKKLFKHLNEKTNENKYFLFLLYF